MIKNTKNKSKNLFNLNKKVIIITGALGLLGKKMAVRYNTKNYSKVSME